VSNISKVSLPTSDARHLHMLAVIPARGGSKSLPRKNVLPLAGVPLIVYTVRAALQSGQFADVVVSTDDAEIAAIAREAGASVPFMRPNELASDTASLWPVLRHAVTNWEEKHRRADIVVLLQPTSPLRTEHDIKACIAQFQKTGSDLCCSASRGHDSPYFNMVEITPESRPYAKPCTTFMRQNQRRQDAPPVFSLNGAIYVLKRSLLDSMESQFYPERLMVYEMPFERSIDIDTQGDFALAEYWLTRAEGAHV
jgi:CMP-N,N'-diacetyllegionaminic acid synthase